MLDHLHGLQILLAAVHVGHPFPVIFAIVQIQHAGHGVHADAVRVKFLHPEQRISYQIVVHLGPSVIVDQCSPVGMEALTGILMLIQACAVKAGQSMGISGKMSRHPVQNHADARLVQFVDKIHKVLGAAVPGSGCIITDDLVPPGSVEGMLHDGHQFHMGITHLLHIGHHLGGNVSVIGVWLAFPGLRKEPIYIS